MPTVFFQKQQEAKKMEQEQGMEDVTPDQGPPLAKLLRVAKSEKFAHSH